LAAISACPPDRLAIHTPPNFASSAVLALLAPSTCADSSHIRVRLASFSVFVFVFVFVFVKLIDFIFYYIANC
jgi:hypothetical protein